MEHIVCFYFSEYHSITKKIVIYPCVCKIKVVPLHPI